MSETTLDKNYKGIKALFGEPDQESILQHGFGGPEFPSIIYERNDYSIKFSFEPDNAGSFATIDIFTNIVATDSNIEFPSQGDFSKTIEFNNMEIFAHSDYTVSHNYDVDFNTDNKYTFLSMGIKNIGSSPQTLSYYDVSVFGPNGMEMSPVQGVYSDNVFTDRGDILPGVSQDLVIIIPYIGAGDYTIYLNSILSENSLTLPIDQNSAEGIAGLAGKWVLDASASNGFYSQTKVNYIELFEDGTGIMSSEGEVLDITWSVNMRDTPLSLSFNFANDPTLVMTSTHEISATTLRLVKARQFKLNMMEQDYDVTHEGVDVFVRQ